jgi:hypothetical protein
MAIWSCSSNHHSCSLLDLTVLSSTIVDWCFLPTFIIFCTVSFLLIRFVLENAQNFYFKLATIIICGGMCLSYFLVATSNPGVVTDEDLTDS